MVHATPKLASMSRTLAAPGLSLIAPTDPQLEAVTVLLVTDLEGFTPLLVRLGDHEARTIMRAHNRVLRDCLAAHQGLEVAHTGDGVLAAFRSVKNALRCAAHMQQRFSASTDAPPDVQPRIRIGIHVGEPLPEDGRLFGVCVNTAVRVCAVASAGSVLVSDLVRALAAGHAARFIDRGFFALKGLDAEVHLHELICEPPVAPTTQAPQTSA
jgi:class 3 adenylate cyclase